MTLMNLIHRKNLKELREANSRCTMFSGSSEVRDEIEEDKLVDEDDERLENDEEEEEEETGAVFELEGVGRVFGGGTTAVAGVFQS